MKDLIKKAKKIFENKPNPEIQYHYDLEGFLKQPSHIQIKVLNQTLYDYVTAYLKLLEENEQLKKEIKILNEN